MKLDARFWCKVDKKGPVSRRCGTRCWLWTAGKLPSGYGKFKVFGVEEYAHRVAWELSNGCIPISLCVLHKCDNPSCVRHSHLFLGTKADNNADRSRKGRGASGDRHSSRTHPELILRGSSHPNAKLDECKVASIRSLYTSGNYTQQRLADQFGVHQAVISGIVRGTMWKPVLVGDSA